MPESDILLRVDNLRVSFRVDKNTVFEAVKGISFDVPLNRTVALVGESGSGKSVSALRSWACCRKAIRLSIRRQKSCLKETVFSG